MNVELTVLRGGEEAPTSAKSAVNHARSSSGANAVSPSGAKAAKSATSPANSAGQAAQQTRVKVAASPKREVSAEAKSSLARLAAMTSVEILTEFFRPHLVFAAASPSNNSAPASAIALVSRTGWNALSALLFREFLSTRLWRLITASSTGRLLVPAASLPRELSSLAEYQQAAAQAVAPRTVDSFAIGTAGARATAANDGFASALQRRDESSADQEQVRSPPAAFQVSNLILLTQYAPLETVLFWLAALMGARNVSSSDTRATVPLLPAEIRNGRLALLFQLLDRERRGLRLLCCPDSDSITRTVSRVSPGKFSKTDLFETLDGCFHSSFAVIDDVSSSVFELSAESSECACRTNRYG